MTWMTDTEEPWQPNFPTVRESRVSLRDFEFQTNVANNRAGIIVQDQTLEDPACFWIDYSHVYLRTNWSLWSTVSLDSPEQVVSICNAHFCRVSLIKNNDLSDRTVPVYHIAALPPELFQEDGENLTAKLKKSQGGKDEYKQCLDLVKETVATVGKDLGVFEHVKFGHGIAACVISDDEHAIILDFAPPDREFDFVPGTGEELHRLAASWPSDEISMDFVEKLREVKAELAKLEPDVRIDIGFLANVATIENLRQVLAEEGISDVMVFSYENLVAELTVIYSLQSDGKSDTVAERVKALVAEHLGVDPSKVQEDSFFERDLGADELDFVELTMALEEEFDCPIIDLEFDKTTTVQDVIEVIERHAINNS